jgi:hypothetical protein
VGKPLSKQVWIDDLLGLNSTIASLSLKILETELKRSEDF